MHVISATSGIVGAASVSTSRFFLYKPHQVKAATSGTAKMEAASFCHNGIHNFSPSFSQAKLKHLPKLCAKNHSYNLKFRQQWKVKNGLPVRCVAMGTGSVAELEKQLESEMRPEEEAWLKEENLTEKCKERKGMLELLECLEREAIMGDDEGKEPTDYSRRAQIFDKSSRVFQALKELTGNSSQQS